MKLWGSGCGERFHGRNLLGLVESPQRRRPWEDSGSTMIVGHRLVAAELVRTLVLSASWLCTQRVRLVRFFAAMADTTMDARDSLAAVAVFFVFLFLLQDLLQPILSVLVILFIAFAASHYRNEPYRPQY